MTSSARDDLRRAMRRMRRQLSAVERRVAARRFAAIAARTHLLKPGSRIAVYHAYGAEADASLLIERAWQLGCEVYLPVITHSRTSRMSFFPFDANTPLRLNSFGIPEPPSNPATRIAALHLDVIFMPLVAFDRCGWRLGSGAGFYDRCLSHLRSHRLWRRPKLVGVAYAQQEVDHLESNAWDVPMDAVLTPKGFKRFSTQRQGATR